MEGSKNWDVEGGLPLGLFLTDSPRKLPSPPPGLSGEGAPCLRGGAFELKSLCPFRKTSPGSSTSPVPSATQATGMSSPYGPLAASPTCTPKVPSLATLERGPMGAWPVGGGHRCPVGLLSKIGASCRDMGAPVALPLTPSLPISGVSLGTRPA